MKKIYAQLFTVICLLFMTTGAFAQPGVLDQTFGVGGKSVMPDTVLPVEIKIQPDQKILVLSMFGEGYFCYGYLLTRFNPNGTLDSSFGTNGSNRVLNSERPYALAIQTDGKILVSGAIDTGHAYLSPYTGTNFGLTRYMPDGSIDNSFGTNGKVFTDFSLVASVTNYLNDRPTSVFVLPNGQIIQGGYSIHGGSSSEGYFSLARFNTNGTLDNTYGVNGKLMIRNDSTIRFFNIQTEYNNITNLLMQPNGKIIIGIRHLLTGITANGTIDSTFGVNGRAPLPFESCRSAVLQPDGKMIFLGENIDHTGVYWYNPYYFSMYRYNTDGSLDTSFENGRYIPDITDQGVDYYYGDLMIEPGGNIMLGFGYVNTGASVLRFKPNGVLDSSYGRRGIVSVQNKIQSKWFGLCTAAQQTDGKILFGTTASYQDNSYLMRIEKNALVYYNTVVGKVFYDLNRNGVQDANESKVRYAAITSMKPGVDTVNTYSDFNGRFLTDIDTGTYRHSVKNFSLPYYNMIPAIKTTNHSTYFNTDSISFAAQPVPGIRDLSVSLIPLRVAKAGFHTYYLLNLHNAGTDTAVSIMVKLVKSNKLNYNGALPLPTTNIADTLTWDISSLLPRQDSSILIDFIVKAPPAANAGDSLFSMAIITSNKPDSTMADNTSTLNQIVRNAYDPNDKTENHGGKITLAKAIAGEYLTYTIRFQNTGNDTAFNVYIRDTMDSELDWNSLQIVASSHNYQMTMNDGKCLFTFPFIKLVDSIHNEPKSHGYVVYKVKTKPNVQIGDVIKNTAAIYFDYNLPVMTNTETTKIVADALPLKLLSFTAKKDGKTNLLQWSTANEIKVDRFEIERSNNSRAFSKIGTVKAGQTQYSFTDEKPATGNTNYYRLKMLDKDGQFTYSPIRMINNNGSVSVNIFPNPAKDVLQVQIETDKNTTLQLILLSGDGKVLLSKIIAASEGSSLQSINISALPKGSYLMKVVSSDKEESVVKFEKL